MSEDIKFPRNKAKFCKFPTRWIYAEPSHSSETGFGDVAFEKDMKDMKDMRELEREAREIEMRAIGMWRR